MIRSGASRMFVLAVLSLTLAIHKCLPVSQSIRMEVVPKSQLANLVEDDQINQSGRRRIKRIDERIKRQIAEPVPTVDKEVENVTEQKSVLPVEQGRTKAFSADIARILAAAGAKPSPIDPDSRSYAGRRRRSPQIEPLHSNAHQYGLKEPKVEKVKVKSHGNFGKDIQTPVVVVKKDHSNFINGAKERRKRNTYDFIPFSVYDARRIKTLKVEENDFHALPLRLQIENRIKLAREAKALQIQLTATQ